MKSLLIFGILFFPLAVSQCPTEDISPCKCTEIRDQGSLSCMGNMPLTRLIAILRKLMCGRTLEKFELLGSNISYLPSNLFSKMRVTEINVYSTNIRRFANGSQSAFSGLEDCLSSLSMRRCSLVDGLQWQIFRHMHTLAYLDLSYNELTHIPIEWTEEPPPNLRSLLLKGNKISTLKPGSLQWMYSLVELDLSENRIMSYSRQALPLAGNSLIVLRLSYNKLESIPEDSFDGLLGLRRLYLDNNNITYLEESTWRPIWGDLEALDLNGNEVQCDNSILWMPKLRAPVRLYGECADKNLKGKHLRTLSIDDLEV